MLKKSISIFLTVFAVVVFIGCGGPDFGSSVIIDTSLPSINSLESFSGSAVTSTEEAAALLMDVVGIIMSMELFNFNEIFSGSILTSVSSVPFNSMAARNTTAINEIIDEAIDGVGSVKGFINGSLTETDTEMDASGSAKIAVDMNFNDGEYMVKGKFILEGNASVSSNDQQIKFEIKASNNYAMSVSNGSVGMKFALMLEVDFPQTTLVFDDFENMDYIEGLIESYLNYVSFNLNIYDNSNSLVLSITKADLIDIINENLEGIFEL